MTDEMMTDGELETFLKGEGVLAEVPKKLTVAQFGRYLEARVAAFFRPRVVVQDDETSLLVCWGGHAILVPYAQADLRWMYSVRAQQTTERLYTMAHHDRSRIEEMLVRPELPSWEPKPAGVYQFQNRQSFRGTPLPAVLSDAEAVERCLDSIDDLAVRRQKESALRLALSEPELCRGTLDDVRDAVLGQVTVEHAALDAQSALGDGIFGPGQLQELGDLAERAMVAEGRAGQLEDSLRDELRSGRRTRVGFMLAGMLLGLVIGVVIGVLLTRGVVG